MITDDQLLSSSTVQSALARMRGQGLHKLANAPTLDAAVLDLTTKFAYMLLKQARIEEGLESLDKLASPVTAATAMPTLRRVVPHAAAMGGLGALSGGAVGATYDENDPVRGGLAGAVAGGLLGLGAGSIAGGKVRDAELLRHNAEKNLLQALRNGVGPAEGQISAELADAGVKAVGTRAQEAATAQRNALLSGGAAAALGGGLVGHVAGNTLRAGDAPPPASEVLPWDNYDYGKVANLLQRVFRRPTGGPVPGHVPAPHAADAVVAMPGGAAKITGGAAAPTPNKVILPEYIRNHQPVELPKMQTGAERVSPPSAASKAKAKPTQTFDPHELQANAFMSRLKPASGAAEGPFTLAGMKGRVSTAAFNVPGSIVRGGLAGAGVGAVGGAIGAGEGNRMQGALGGAALGAGVGAGAGQIARMNYRSGMQGLTAAGKNTQALQKGFANRAGRAVSDLRAGDSASALKHVDALRGSRFADITNAEMLRAGTLAGGAAAAGIGAAAIAPSKKTAGIFSPALSPIVTGGGLGALTGTLAADDEHRLHGALAGGLAGAGLGYGAGVAGAARAAGIETRQLKALARHDASTTARDALMKKKRIPDREYMKEVADIRRGTIADLGKQGISDAKDLGDIAAGGLGLVGGAGAGYLASKDAAFKVPGSIGYGATGGALLGGLGGGLAGPDGDRTRGALTGAAMGAALGAGAGQVARMGFRGDMHALDAAKGPGHAKELNSALEAVRAQAQTAREAGNHALAEQLLTAPAFEPLLKSEAERTMTLGGGTALAGLAGTMGSHAAGQQAELQRQRQQGMPWR